MRAGIRAGTWVPLLWVAWLGGITVTHRALQAEDEAPVAPGSPVEKGAEKKRYDLAYLPVTCHLTCPVTDYITRSAGTPGQFSPQRFSGWPELKEAFLSGRTPAAFVLAPMAMALREQGVPLKIVYLGHRDGTAMMVNVDSDIHEIADLRGKTVAFPNRFSNQYLLLYRALKLGGMTIADVNAVELPPPDMPAALQTHAVDAVTSGEPFMARTEMEGYGRTLFQTSDVWPGFISCVLTVREELIRDDPAAVQELVSGIARSGQWLQGGQENRMEAAKFVAKSYYNQDPSLLSYVLSREPERVRYDDLDLRRADFEDIEALAVEAGIIAGTVHFDDYADPRFSRAAGKPIPWEWEVPALAETPAPDSPTPSPSQAQVPG